MIPDQELKDIYEELHELLDKINADPHPNEVTAKLITTCMTFARTIDHIHTLQEIHIRDTRQHADCIADLRDAVQALTHR
jgi:hypothetical protein